MKINEVRTNTFSFNSNSTEQKNADNKKRNTLKTLGDIAFFSTITAGSSYIGLKQFKNLGKNKIIAGSILFSAALTMALNWWGKANEKSAEFLGNLINKNKN